MSASTYEFNLGMVEHPERGNPYAWQHYVCGYCGANTNGAVVALFPSGRHPRHQWLLCTVCCMPSVKTAEGRISPGATCGPLLEGLPTEIETAYNEARECLTVNALTACELVCRKILMHVAVDKGATEGESFKHYIEYLANEGYVTPPMKPWVTLIKNHGNEATHKLPSPDRERAESTLMFTAELLRLVYEMDMMTKRYVPAPTP